MIRLLFLSLLVVFSFSAVAVAQEEVSETTEKKYTYEGMLALGHGKYVTGDFAGALAMYEKAKSSAPARAEAYYFVGCVLKAQKQYQEAISQLASSATVAGEDDPSVHARALFVIAITWESAQNLDKAKYAWIDYKAYVKLHPQITGFAAIAEAHVLAIDERASQVEANQQVTERIAASRK